MITKELHCRAARIERAKEALDKAILARMDVIARRLGLNEMVITHMGNCYRQGDSPTPVKSKQLDELDDLYGDHVHAGGFEGVWTPEKGWH